MREMIERTIIAVKHIKTLDDVFTEEGNFKPSESPGYMIYRDNIKKLNKEMDNLELPSQLYSENDRQMKLADLIEYMLLGRGYYSMRPKSQEDRGHFVKLILRFVNVLMSYETITISNKLRHQVLVELGKNIPDITSEETYDELLKFKGTVGLPQDKCDAPKYLNKYFDTLLPKTAGGLWHELLV